MKSKHPLECILQARIPSEFGTHRVLYYQSTEPWDGDQIVATELRPSDNSHARIATNDGFDRSTRGEKVNGLNGNGVMSNGKANHVHSNGTLNGHSNGHLKEHDRSEANSLSHDKLKRSNASWDDNNHLALVFGPYTSKSLLNRSISQSHQEKIRSGASLTLEEYCPTESTLVRIHSCCFTGETLGSTRCDCAEQLHTAMRRMAKSNGILIYLKQEGRGIGLLDKLQCYNLIDSGQYDTLTANLALGHPPDLRDYRAASYILLDLGITRVSLLTNNPDKIKQLQECGINVVERLEMVPILAGGIYADRDQYLDTKIKKMGHLLNLD